MSITRWNIPSILPVIFMVVGCIYLILIVIYSAVIIICIRKIWFIKGMMLTHIVGWIMHISIIRVVLADIWTIHPIHIPTRYMCMHITLIANIIASLANSLTILFMGCQVVVALSTIWNIPSIVMSTSCMCMHITLGKWQNNHT